jgi:hypothetical protein
MKKYFVLNYLSFNSLNIARLLGTQGLCAAHAPYDMDLIKIAPLCAGYTVSFFYKELLALYPDATFILLKENTTTIEDHLMYSYFNNIYSEAIEEDFQKHWGVTFESGVLPDINKKITKYYNDVSNFFNKSPNFYTLDISEFGNVWTDFMLSPKLEELFKDLEIKFPAQKAKVEQGKILTGHRYPYLNYLVDGFRGAGILNMPMGVMVSTLNFPVSKQLENHYTYTDLLGDDLLKALKAENRVVKQ